LGVGRTVFIEGDPAIRWVVSVWLNPPLDAIPAEVEVPAEASTHDGGKPRPDR
jgi:hypothetical protein